MNLINSMKEPSTKEAPKEPTVVTGNSNLGGFLGGILANNQSPKQPSDQPNPNHHVEVVDFVENDSSYADANIDSARKAGVLGGSNVSSEKDDRRSPRVPIGPHVVLPPLDHNNPSDDPLHVTS